jgi:guanylate kinase
LADPAHKPGLLFILSGPSGVGKDAAIKLMQEHGFPMHYAVTATTRPIRANETPGKDYIFLTEDTFNAKLAADGFLENATVYGKCYGTPKEQVLEPLQRGEDVLLKIDVQGADTVKEKIAGAIRIFLAPSNFQELRQRLVDRMTDSGEALQRRLFKAENEMAHSDEFDYVVYNRADQLEAAVLEIQEIVRKQKTTRG